MPRLIGGLLLVFALCALASLADSNSVRLPITTFLGGHSFALSNFAATQGGVVSVDQSQIDEFYYTFEIEYGTPGQTMNVAFDLTSPSSEVASSQCTTKYCKRINLFNSDDSSTFQDTNLSNSSSRSVGTDTVSVGGATVTDSTFILLNNVDASSSYPAFDGIVGLSSSRFSTYGTPSLFDDMLSQGAIDQGMFSIYLDSKPGSTKSAVVLGGVDDDLYTGEISWRPLTSTRYWATRLVAITLDAARVHYCPDPCRVIFSTLDSYIYGPPVYVRKVNSALNIAPSCSNYNTLPRLVFHLGPHYLSIPRSSYVSRSNGTCKSRILEGSNLKQNWILGNLFLRSYYTIFDADNQRIGWAPLPPTIISSKQ